MTVWKTWSPNTSMTRAITSRACRVRASNMVMTIPDTASFGLSRSRTLATVSVSSASRAAEEHTFHRDDDALGAGQRVHRQQSQRRLAVDEHVVVAIEHRMQCPRQ